MQRAFSASVLLLLAACGPLRAGAQPPLATCWSPPVFGPQLVSYVSGLVTRNDTTTVRVRQASFLLPSTADSVAVVTDEAVCQQAAAAVATRRGLPSPVSQVMVVRAGSQRYVVMDGSRGGSYFLNYVFDGAFTFLGGFTT